MKNMGLCLCMFFILPSHFPTCPVHEWANFGDIFQDRFQIFECWNHNLHQPDHQQHQSSFFGSKFLGSMREAKKKIFGFRWGAGVLWNYSSVTLQTAPRNQESNPHRGNNFFSNQKDHNFWNHDVIYDDTETWLWQDYNFEEQCMYIFFMIP